MSAPAVRVTSSSEHYSCAPKGPGEVGITIAIFIVFVVLIGVNILTLTKNVDSGCNGVAGATNATLSCTSAQDVVRALWGNVILLVLLVCFFLGYLFAARSKTTR